MQPYQTQNQSGTYTVGYSDYLLSCIMNGYLFYFIVCVNAQVGKGNEE